MKYTNFLFIFLVIKTILLETIFSFEIDQVDDDDIVYGTPNFEIEKSKRDPMEELKKEWRH